jgi:hypothetical protein
MYVRLPKNGFFAADFCYGKTKQTADGDTESWAERVSGARPVAAE